MIFFRERNRRDQLEPGQRVVGLRLGDKFLDTGKRIGFEGRAQRRDTRTELIGQVDHAVACKRTEARLSREFKRKEFHESNPKSLTGLSTRIFFSIASSGTKRYSASSRSASFGGCFTDTG